MTDEYAPAYTTIVVATRSRSRYWDGDAVRVPYADGVVPVGGSAATKPPAGVKRAGDSTDWIQRAAKHPVSNPAGAPLLDWWHVPAHTVMERLVLSMCPGRVCTTCGEPSRRIERTDTEYTEAWSRQPELAAHIKERREALGLTSAEINGWFGYKEIAKNWERTDPHGARIPDPNDWPLLKERLKLSEEFDALVLGERRWSSSESTVEYVTDDGRALALGERRETYDRGGVPQDGTRTHAARSAPDRWSDCGHNTWREGVTLDPFQRNEDDVSTRYLIGDVFDGLATIPDHSVDLIVSSPPFLALRSYLPADHEHKQLEIGSEATPGEFLDKLLDVVEECARVLAPHGSLVFELGDTYAGNGDGVAERAVRVSDDVPDRGLNAKNRGTIKAEGTVRVSGGNGWPLDKSKVLVPQLFAISLAYGFNPLTGRTTDPWRIRNTVAWCRPNPPVGRDGDKFRPATSFLTVATKARDRYWDGDAVRTEPVSRPQRFFSHRTNKGGSPETAIEWPPELEPTVRANPAGAPLLDYWVIPTEPYGGSHYATFPRQLVVPLVKAMCPSRVCRVCGEPSRRILTKTPEYAAFRDGRSPSFEQKTDVQHARHLPEKGGVGSLDYHDDAGARGQLYETLGWTECLCECPAGWATTCTAGYPGRACPHKWRPGLVLDPFAGSGTTLAVASGHGLDSIGIDIDHRNAELAAERVGGLFLEVEEIASSGSSTRQGSAIPGGGQRPPGVKPPAASARFRAGYDRRDGRKTMQREDYGAPLPKRTTT